MCTSHRRCEEANTKGLRDPKHNPWHAGVHGSQRLAHTLATQQHTRQVPPALWAAHPRAHSLLDSLLQMPGWHLHCLAHPGHLLNQTTFQSSDIPRRGITRCLEACILFPTIYWPNKGPPGFTSGSPLERIWLRR